jgi:hypothetical protein
LQYRPCISPKNPATARFFTFTNLRARNRQKNTKWKNEAMRLSMAAKKELEDILRYELGEEGFRPFDDGAIHDLGSRLLRLTALVLKRERRK